MSTPPVSVLMPVYNGERYLREAVDSVLCQSFSDLEFIVVNDGSTDATSSILSQNHDPRFKVFNIPHLGLIAALNECVSHSSGRYLARMDADDISYPCRIARQAEYLDTHSETDIVTCRSDLLDPFGQVVGRGNGGVGRDMILELAASNDIVHGSVMARRGSMPKMPVYVKRPEDYVLWVELARGGKQFECIPETLYGFRSHPDRYSLTQANSQSEGIVEVQWPLLEECIRTRNIDDPGVRSRLLRGWGTVGGAAFRSAQCAMGLEAYMHFCRLARIGDGKETEAAILTGLEAMIWGGCPFPQNLVLRLRELRLRPTHSSSYRKLLLTFPWIEKLYEKTNRWSGSW